MRTIRCFLAGLAVAAGLGCAVCRADVPAAQAEAAEYAEVGRVVGYQSPQEFTAFLQEARNGQPAAAKDPFAGKSTLLIVLIVLAGGFLLNLMPCVLPMIPVNLAILAGAGNGASGRRGFANGCVYGAGIAVAYGVLGVVTVATGMAFGAWHASVWFNGVAAAFFVALALAMLDVFVIDFSRWGRLKGGGVFGLGAASALLAGACVAPVLVAVLVFSAQVYAEGRWWLGVLLPLVLGVGMASPWPFIAAGVRLLPKPGVWMVWMKRAFAVVLIGFAVLYYGKNVYAALVRVPGQGGGQVEEGMRAALAAGKPVVLHFTAAWCPSCVEMEGGTLKDEAVLRALQDFAVVKVDATDPDEREVRAFLRRFDVKGIPTFVVIGRPSE